MKITTARMKEIILEEVKAMAESGDYHDFGGEDEMIDFLDADDGGAYDTEAEAGLDNHATPSKIDDQQIEDDIEEMLATLDLTVAQRNTLETIKHHILGGDMGIDDMPPLKTTRNAPFADRDKDGNRINKEGLARIIHEETVKAIKEITSHEAGKVQFDDDPEMGDDTDTAAALDRLSAQLRQGQDPKKIENDLANILAQLQAEMEGPDPAGYKGFRHGGYDDEPMEEDVDAQRKRMRKRAADRRKREAEETAKDSVDVRLPHKEGVVDMDEGGQVINKDGEMIFTDTDGDASDKARMAARRNDYEKVLEKIANMIKSGKPQLAYDEALKMLSASSEKGRERANAIEPEDAMEEGQYETGAERKKRENAREQKIQDLMKSQGLSRSAAEKFASRSYSQTR